MIERIGFAPHPYLGDGCVGKLPVAISLALRAAALPLHTIDDRGWVTWMPPLTKERWDALDHEALSYAYARARARALIAAVTEPKD